MPATSSSTGCNTAAAKGPVRVMLAGGQAEWRDRLRSDLVDGFEVVAEAADAAEAVATVLEARPQLVVCDLQLPGGGGTRMVRLCGQTTRIVMWTHSDQDRDLLAAISAGAVGHVVGSTVGPELRASLLRAAAGQPLLSPALAAAVLGELRRMAKAAADTNPLSERDREVLQLMAAGRSYGEVGAALSVTEQAVENQVRDILAKLHLNRSHEVIRDAVERGIE